MVSIAIDGPAGAGKSTLARAAAKELGYIYVDTGALYRALALKFLRTKTPMSGETAAGLLEKTEVTLGFSDGEQHVFLDGEDVSHLIRTPQVSMAASKVSALPQVRAHLLELQRAMGRTENILMDGRDIGTVVLPNASVKIFLTASAEERARRRYNELCERGEKVTFEQVYRELCERDYGDSHRAAAPLRAAEDSVTVDTTGLDAEQSLRLLLQTIRERLG